ncbi:MAG: glutamate 5-kinase, partial [Pseudolabrys sp.]
MPKSPSLKDFRRIVVKVGSSLLVDSSAGGLKREWLASLAADVAALHKDGRDVLVVSSGAIALGRAVLRLPPGALKLEDSQAAAAVGQIALARAWAEALG